MSEVGLRRRAPMLAPLRASTGGRTSGRADRGARAGLATVAAITRRRRRDRPA